MTTKVKGYFCKCSQCGFIGHISLREKTDIKLIRQDLCPLCLNGTPPKPVIDDTFGKELRKTRLESNHSFRDISKLLGLTLPEYCEIETGRVLISEEEQKRFMDCVKGV